MGIDMKKMRQKYATLKNRGSGGGQSYFWRPQDGEQTIRIVPTADGDPFREFWFHYNVGNASGFLSPKKNFGEDDPLNDFVRSLYKEGTEESIKMAKSLSARQRFFTPVIVRGEEDQGVRIWGFGKQVYETLLQLVLNPEYGDITDTDSGTDLTLNYGKPAGAQFPQTKLTPKRRPSPLLEDQGRVKEALESIPDFSTLFERKTAAQVQTILDEFLLSDEDAEGVSSETTKYSDATTDVDKAFQELL
jgi:hypothetical protein